MEPGGILQDLFPVKQVHRCLGDAGICTVINDLGRTLVGTGLEEIDAHTAIHHLDIGHIDAKTADLAQAGLADGIVRKSGNKRRVHSVVCKRNCYVRLAAAKGCLERGALEETLKCRALETEHNFTKCNNFSHFESLLTVVKGKFNRCDYTWTIERNQVLSGSFSRLDTVRDRPDFLPGLIHADSLFSRSARDSPRLP